MTTGEHDVLREDREERKTKEEEMKDPGPPNFLSELVTEENLSPEVATSYRKLAQTMANQFQQELRSCITFIHAENQVTQDTVTERMTEAAKAFKEAQEEHATKTQLEMENLRIQLRSLEG
jgi:predicted ATPase